MRLLLNNYQKYSLYYHLGFILLLAVVRVLASRVLPCPEQFDCNAYLQMVDSWGYQSEVQGHHAMRILPPMIVNLLTVFGLTKTQGFYLLSGLGYCLFGGAVYLFLIWQKINRLVALSIALLCLAPHPAMRIPLQLVYQSCDMLVYPWVLGMLVLSLQQKPKTLFIFSLLGILIRQNLFVLGVLSLLYCAGKKFHWAYVLYLFGLIAAYAVLQNYYHANDTFVQLLSPPEGYFKPSHLWWVLWDSRILELILPILPLLLIHAKSLFHWCLKYWHLTLYMAITVGQPFLAYHMTGNNFPRLALQGAWLWYLALGFVFAKQLQTKFLLTLLLIYSLSIYFTWGINPRVYLMLGYSCVLAAWYLYSQMIRADVQEKPVVTG